MYAEAEAEGLAVLFLGAEVHFPILILVLPFKNTNSHIYTFPVKKTKQNIKKFSNFDEKRYTATLTLKTILIDPF